MILLKTLKRRAAEGGRCNSKADNQRHLRHDDETRKLVVVRPITKLATVTFVVANDEVDKFERTNERMKCQCLTC